MSRHRAGAGELCVGVHAAEGVSHTIGSGTGCHVIGMERTARTTTGSYAEVGLACEDTLLLVRTGYGVLEASGVGGVTGDGDIHVLFPHDGYAFAHVVSTIAVHLGTGAIAVSRFLDHLELAREIVELGLYIGEAVDAADDHGSVLAQTIEDAAEGLVGGTALVGHLCNLDSAFSSCEALVAGQESEALRLGRKQTGSEAAVADTYLTVVSYGAGDAESLQAFADVLGSFHCVLSLFLECDGSTHDVGPLCVFEANHLRALAFLIGVETVLFANLVSFFDILDTMLVECGENLLDSAVLALEFYFSDHVVVLLNLYVGQ